MTAHVVTNTHSSACPGAPAALNATSGRTLVVAIEHHFVKVGDGVYTTLAFGYDYWQQYLEIFRDVKVLARLGHARDVPQGHFRADGPRVSFIPVPEYLGPKQFLQRLPGVLRAARQAALGGDHFVLRSGNVCSALWLWLLLYRQAYAREVQGDIREAIRHFTSDSRPRLGGLIASVSDWLCSLQVRHASCASYVSEYCRRRYPTRHGEREYVFSSVALSPALVTAPRPPQSFAEPELKFVCVGRLEAEKGHAVVLRACRILIEEGVIRWRLRIVGSGRQLEPLRETVWEYGLGERVELVGPKQYGPELFEQLDWANVYVMPSLTEGMPRSLIEAMARGLPAIGSRVGGIVELLTPSQLVSAGDAASLSGAMASRISDRSALASDSRQNFEKATTCFSPQRMRAQRLAFWTAVTETASGREG